MVIYTFAGKILTILNHFLWINYNYFFKRDAKSMARDVNEILINICKTEGNMATADATQYIKDLSHKTRYVLDVWS